MNDKTNNDHFEWSDYLKDSPSSSESDIIHPYFAHPLDSIIVPQNFNMNEPVESPLTPGIQVNSKEVIGNLELIDDVIDTPCPNGAMTIAPGMYVIKTKYSLTQESGDDSLRAL